MWIIVEWPFLRRAVFKEVCTKLKKAEVKNKQRFNCVLRNQQLEAFLHEKDKQTITFS